VLLSEQGYGSISLNGVNSLQPLVSIGIPTYNNPNGLRNVLKNITSQSYENLEIIVSINATPNHDTNLDCILICKEFKDKDSRINWYFQLNNIGADNNFLFVKEKSAGKYFMWAQDDDWWSNQFIEKLVAELEKNPEIPLACCPSQFVSPDGRKSELRYLNNLSVFNAVGNGDLGLACNGIWKRDSMIQIEFPRNQVLGIDHILPAIILLKYGKILVVNSERYAKGYTTGKFQNCFKYQPFYAFTSWWFMMKTLLESPDIPNEKKVLIPLIAVTNLIRALGITGVQMIISMPDNPVKTLVQNRFFGAN
jgi:hypothetical protein